LSKPDAANGFQPLTALDANKDGLVAGIIVQFGGQTPLNLARGLKNAGVPIIGTAVESIETAEDRKLFNEMINTVNFEVGQSYLVAAYDGQVSMCYSGAASGELRSPFDKAFIP
jgi:carbamoylphosphate synthase large subunit